MTAILLWGSLGSGREEEEVEGQVGMCSSEWIAIAIVSKDVDA